MKMRRQIPFFLMLVLGRCVLPEAAHAGDWMDGNNTIEHCRKFAAVAGGVAALTPHEQAVVYETSQGFSSYKRGMLGDAITFVVDNKIRSPTVAQSVALSRCSGHRKSGPSLWEWNVGAGFIGPY